MDNNYLTIQGWMVSKLGLSGNDLLVFALIYGFSQDGETEFTGSINYITRWLNCSRPTAMKALRVLTEKSFICKSTVTMNGVSFNRYKVNLGVVKKLYTLSKSDDLGSKETLQGVVKKLDGGSKETLPNNTINTIIDNKEEIITFDEFWSMYGKSSDKKKCSEKFERLTDKELDKIKSNLPNYILSTPDVQFRKNPLTWLNGKCWEDEVTVPKQSVGQVKVLGITAEGEEITDPLVFSVYKQMGRI
jgi:hypothetical protein